MCKICEHKISRKSPITISGYWSDTNRSATITSDLTKCTIAIPDVVVMSMKNSLGSSVRIVEKNFPMLSKNI